MAQVFPFRAFRYNPAHAPFEQVLTQPYDKISPAMQDKYYAANPHNLITVEKGRVYPSDAEVTTCTRERRRRYRNGFAAESWCRIRTARFYGYTQEYTVPGTQRASDASWIHRRGTTGRIFGRA